MHERQVDLWFQSTRSWVQGFAVGGIVFEGEIVGLWFVVCDRFPSRVADTAALPHTAASLGSSAPGPVTKHGKCPRLQPEPRHCIEHKLRYKERREGRRKEGNGESGLKLCVFFLGGRTSIAKSLPTSSVRPVQFHMRIMCALLRMQKPQHRRLTGLSAVTFAHCASGFDSGFPRLHKGHCASVSGWNDLQRPRTRELLKQIEQPATYLSNKSQWCCIQGFEERAKKGSVWPLSPTAISPRGNPGLSEQYQTLVCTLGGK
eukprot:1695005-Rhodomonas_salina.1